ncbi:hypothetical protein LJC64_02305 [Ruminococcaceae bacterium OttesenSCG-928-A11]|nr:hypothetical protein [Ruminococcaceae bacterium OttesenSCG-928-A11]
MVDYGFYTEQYKGDSIPAADFPRAARDATAQLEKLKRTYTVTGDEYAENMAVCAMAEALYYYEQAASGGVATSVSVGSVSSSVKADSLPDTSPAAQAAELYRCASLYLDIYRGVC